MFDSIEVRTTTYPSQRSQQPVGKIIRAIRWIQCTVEPQMLIQNCFEVAVENRLTYCFHITLTSLGECSCKPWPVQIIRQPEPAGRDDGRLFRWRVASLKSSTPPDPRGIRRMSSYRPMWRFAYPLDSD